jgi:hypothetical protein
LRIAHAFASRQTGGGRTIGSQLFCQQLARRDLYNPRSIAGGGISWMEATDTMIVNLNRFRKKREHAEAERRAAENRVRFGRGKAQRIKEAHEIERAKKAIDDKRLD